MRAGQQSSRRSLDRRDRPTTSEQPNRESPPPDPLVETAAVRDDDVEHTCPRTAPNGERTQRQPANHGARYADNDHHADPQVREHEASGRQARRQQHDKRVVARTCGARSSDRHRERCRRPGRDGDVRRADSKPRAGGPVARRRGRPRGSSSYPEGAASIATDSGLGLSTWIVVRPGATTTIRAGHAAIAIDAGSLLAPEAPGASRARAAANVAPPVTD